MSSARRLIVLLGFTLMVAGVLLLVTQEEEIFVALSVLGFVVVVAAVPRLRRERSEAGDEPATGVQPGAGAEPATGIQPTTGNVTVVPSEPTLEHPAAADPETSREEHEPEPAPPPPAALEPAPPAPPVPTATAPEPEERAAAPSFRRPERWDLGQASSPSASGRARTGPPRPSARTAAVAGTAAGAGALLWAWRRGRR